MGQNIPLFKPAIGQNERQAVQQAFDLGWLGMGSVTKAFEDAIAKFLELDGRYVVATNTGTSALHLALLAAGVGGGDEVIVPSFNYVADHQAITATGATPVFCDIEEKTLGIDVTKAAELISPKTKAILPLHFAGIPCDSDGVYALARQYGLRVIEDACHAFGARINGKLIGSIGDLACFSFDPVKVLTTIDGGAVIASTQGEFEYLCQMRALGIERDPVHRYENRRSWEWDVVCQGFRYHMPNVNASIGLAQIARVNEFIENRQLYCRYYNARLSDSPKIQVPRTNFVDVGSFIYYILVNSSVRFDLMGHLAEKGIQTTVHWVPVHKHRFYRDCRCGDMSVTEEVSERIITLPLHSHMTTKDLDRIIDAILTFLR